MLVLGIDPGVNGAMALYDDAAGTLIIEDMPTLDLKRSSGKSRRMLAPYGLATIIDNWAKGSLIVWLEQSWPRPTDGAIAGFGFGTNYGLIYGVCAAHFLQVELVSPQKWKRALGVSGDKDEARSRASTLLPRHTGQWPLKKHDGRAEAALIALYGARQAQQVAA